MTAQIREDLAWLVSTHESKWPPVGAANWPEWVSLFRGSTPWFKAQLRSRLASELKAYTRNAR